MRYLKTVFGTAEEIAAIAFRNGAKSMEIHENGSVSINGKLQAIYLDGGDKQYGDPEVLAWFNVENTSLESKIGNSGANYAALKGAAHGSVSSKPGGKLSVVVDSGDSPDSDSSPDSEQAVEKVAAKKTRRSSAEVKADKEAKAAAKKAADANRKALADEAIAEAKRLEEEEAAAITLAEAEREEEEKRKEEERKKAIRKQKAKDKVTAAKKAASLAIAAAQAEADGFDYEDDDDVEEETPDPDPEPEPTIDPMQATNKKAKELRAEASKKKKKADVVPKTMKKDMEKLDAEFEDDDDIGGINPDDLTEDDFGPDENEVDPYQVDKMVSSELDADLDYTDEDFGDQ